MGRKIRKPELCVQRRYTNERPILDLFADAYCVYFKEKQKMKSSVHTFDPAEHTVYNGISTTKNQEEFDDGSAA